MHAIHTACGIETSRGDCYHFHRLYCMQSIPLAVLKLLRRRFLRACLCYCMQSIPLAVLKRKRWFRLPDFDELHAIHTACGIETWSTLRDVNFRSKLHAIHTACGIETRNFPNFSSIPIDCMQSILLAVLKKDRFVQNP